MTFAHRGVRERHYVHQLVMAVFVGQCSEGEEVLHRDGRPENCRLSNLMYDTHRENMLDMARHGTSYWANQTHCPYRHEYTPANTYINSKGSRTCRACHRRTSQEYNRRRAAKQRSLRSQSSQ